MASEAERKKVALRRLGDATFSKVDKVSAELFSLTYGAVVTQARPCPPAGSAPLMPAHPPSRDPRPRWCSAAAQGL